MAKPANHEGYDPKVTEDCERVLVTLMRGLGPWKESVYLIGGLTPRYLVAQRPPKVPPHAGTTDVDVVVELQMLAKTDAYATLEENLKRMGFERAENDKRKKQSWRWHTTAKTASGARMIVEILADDPEKSGGKVTELPTEGNVSALNIPHSSMVFDQYVAKEITAPLLDEKGNATETIRHADIVSFTCLKAFAFDDRAEPKDAHDLAYCLEHGDGGVQAAAKAISAARKGKHQQVIEKAIAILSKRFADDATGEGYKKDGPVAVATFEYVASEDNREERLVRQRDVSTLIHELIKAVA